MKDNRCTLSIAEAERKSTAPDNVYHHCDELKKKMKQQTCHVIT